jgi:hypothetical protein
MKRVFSFAVVALALAVATSGWVLSSSESQARARVTVFKPGTQQYYEARMKRCNDNIKGLYRTQQDGFVWPYGYCLSDNPMRVWN